MTHNHGDGWIEQKADVDRSPGIPHETLETVRCCVEIGRLFGFVSFKQVLEGNTDAVDIRRSISHGLAKNYSIEDVKGKFGRLDDATVLM